MAVTTQAPVPVFVARGLDADRAVARLRAAPDVEVTSSPRHATVLVVAGAVPRDHIGALRGVHDQVPAPRGVAAMGVTGDLDGLGLGTMQRVSDDDPALALRDVQADALAGRAESRALGPADNPTEWQGVGPHGQGGEGMMGGTPYGRMMPMPPTEGRDGLALDRLQLRLGPFLPGLPAGLAVDVGLQGDVLEEASLVLADLDEGTIGTPTDPATPATRRVAALADLCDLVGLSAMARRAARGALAPTPPTIAALRRRLDHRWALRPATDGVGRLHNGGDVTTRWRRWLEVPGTEEGARSPSAAEVADLLLGMELGQAMLTLCSLRLELSLSTAAPVGTA